MWVGLLQCKMQLQDLMLVRKFFISCFFFYFFSFLSVCLLFFFIFFSCSTFFSSFSLLLLSFAFNLFSLPFFSSSSSSFLPRFLFFLSKNKGNKKFERKRIERIAFLICFVFTSYRKYLFVVRSKNRLSNIGPCIKSIQKIYRKFWWRFFEIRCIFKYRKNKIFISKMGRVCWVSTYVFFCYFLCFFFFLFSLLFLLSFLFFSSLCSAIFCCFFFFLIPFVSFL